MCGSLPWGLFSIFEPNRLSCMPAAQAHYAFCMHVAATRAVCSSPGPSNMQGFEHSRLHRQGYSPSKLLPAITSEGCSLRCQLQPWLCSHPSHVHVRLMLWHCAIATSAAAAVPTELRHTPSSQALIACILQWSAAIEPSTHPYITDGGPNTSSPLPHLFPLPPLVPSQ